VFQLRFLGQCVLWLIHSEIPTPGASREAELARSVHPQAEIDRHAVCDQQTPRDLNRRRLGSVFKPVCHSERSEESMGSMIASAANALMMISRCSVPSLRSE